MTAPDRGHVFEQHGDSVGQGFNRSPRRTPTTSAPKARRDVGAGAPRLENASRTLVRRSPGNAVSRAEEGRIDDKHRSMPDVLTAYRIRSSPTFGRAVTPVEATSPAAKGERDTSAACRSNGAGPSLLVAFRFASFVAFVGAASECSGPAARVPEPHYDRRHLRGRQDDPGRYRQRVGEDPARRD